jgi:hypothetical protein
MAIDRGDPLEVTTASGRRITVRALGAPEPGRDFEVVWVCTEDEWARAQIDGDEPDGLPWPADAIAEMTSA